MMPIKLLRVANSERGKGNNLSDSFKEAQTKKVNLILKINSKNKFKKKLYLQTNKNVDEMKYLHSFVMIAILYWADVLFALPKEFQLAQNSFEQQRNFSNSNIKDYAEDGYVEDYSEDDPAPAPAAPPLNVKKEKLLYTKEIFIKQGRIKGIIRNFHPQTGLKDVDQYLGIPYAEAPTGSRRFMPPGMRLRK